MRAFHVILPATLSKFLQECSDQSDAKLVDALWYGTIHVATSGFADHDEPRFAAAVSAFFLSQSGDATTVDSGAQLRPQNLRTFFTWKWPKRWNKLLWTIKNTQESDLQIYHYFSRISFLFDLGLLISPHPSTCPCTWPFPHHSRPMEVRKVAIPEGASIWKDVIIIFHWKWIVINCHHTYSNGLQPFFFIWWGTMMLIDWIWGLKAYCFLDKLTWKDHFLARSRYGLLRWDRPKIILSSLVMRHGVSQLSLSSAFLLRLLEVQGHRKSVGSNRFCHIAMAEPDYYQLIGVDRNATLHEIR